MYRIAVTKQDEDTYNVVVVSSGLSSCDNLTMDKATVDYIIAAGKALIHNDPPVSEPDVVGPNSVKISVSQSMDRVNTYILAFDVTSSYVKAYMLSDKELKLFIASLKRAMNG